MTAKTEDEAPVVIGLSVPEQPAPAAPMNPLSPYAQDPIPHVTVE